MMVKTMKKAGVAAFAVALSLSCTVLTGCAKDEAREKVTRVRLSEVTHSVFYAPQYAAMELGYFEEEGIRLEVISGEGADKVMTSVISRAVDVGFSGPEAAIYIYNEGKEDFANLFAQVTQRDGAFLAAREPMPDFKWTDLKDSHLLPGRKGGAPYMALEWVVKGAGLVPGVDVEFDNSIQYAAMTGAFMSGTGDFVTIFEPTASTIEAEGKGFIVASVGESAGEIPYTAYYALKSYIAKNPDVIQGFTNAVARGQKWVKEHTPQEIADVIAPQFPDADIEILAKAIGRYKEIDAYATNPALSEEAFNRLQTVMTQAGELADTVPYSELVDNSFAERAK